jgi:MFS family permease
MAHNTPLAMRGRAAGWFQSGNQFGQTAGGGIALWLIRHMPAPWAAGLVLAAILLVCAVPLAGLEEPPRAPGTGSIAGRARDALRELLTILRARAGRIALILALPIGTRRVLFAPSRKFNASADVVSGARQGGGSPLSPAVSPAAAWRTGCQSRRPTPFPRPRPGRVHRHRGLAANVAWLRGRPSSRSLNGHRVVTGLCSRSSEAPPRYEINCSSP